MNLVVVGWGRGTYTNIQTTAFTKVTVKESEIDKHFFKCFSIHHLWYVPGSTAGLQVNSISQ
jgi:hypothetical protein